MLVVAAWLLRVTLDLGAGGCSGAQSRRLLRKMDVKKLFQDFQNQGVRGWWKREAPGQADVSSMFDDYSAARQKQRVQRLHAHNGLVSRHRTCSGASSCYKTFGMGAGCGVHCWCCTEDACLLGIHIILLACCQLLLSTAGWVWLGKPSFPQAIPRTDMGFSSIFTLACLVAINY